MFWPSWLCFYVTKKQNIGVHINYSHAERRVPPLIWHDKIETYSLFFPSIAAGTIWESRDLPTPSTCSSLSLPRTFSLSGIGPSAIYRKAALQQVFSRSRSSRRLWSIFPTRPSIKRTLFHNTTLIRSNRLFDCEYMHHYFFFVDICIDPSKHSIC